MIAAALRISVFRLQSEYRNALAHGHAQRLCEVVSLLFAKARAGSLPAIRKVLRPTAATMVATEPVRPRRPGKKEIALEAAKTAGEGSDRGHDLDPTDGRPH
ncbi:conserved hypothetical protein [Methylobacterium nodulans ORS 2060]|uniref:Uncharacterized protein n=1 Tax=Methylobacterium nodulans (strain LMG 21967 / CNCM I-2342 / ORS 2060) TaxID=460265 RepID=B8IIA0_METNO|nr:conserved hypothetical protein [Methylobacterium nodulans ORS 2060]